MPIPDGPGKNPSALQRLNLQSTAAILLPAQESYDRIKQRYLAAFPQSQLMFGFGDFSLWELQMRDAHLVLSDSGRVALPEARKEVLTVHNRLNPSILDAR